MITELAVPIVDQILAVIFKRACLQASTPDEDSEDSRDVNLTCTQMDEEKYVVRDQQGSAARRGTTLPW